MLSRSALLAARRAISYQREKYWVASGAIFAGSFMVNSTVLHLATGVAFFYNGCNRMGAIHLDRKSELMSRNAKLHEYSIFRLLRHQLETTESFHEYAQPNTLLVGEPAVQYSDMGFICLFKEIFKIPEKPEDKKFWLKCIFKDPKFEGQGVINCEGYFNSPENYYFRKIVAEFAFPVRKTLVVFDSEIINI
jgi:hypothetical protein